MHVHDIVLLAALHDPMYFLVVLAGAFLSWLGSRIDVFRERKPHRVEAIREAKWWGLIVFPRWRDKLTDCYQLVCRTLSVAPSGTIPSSTKRQSGDAVRAPN